MANTIKAWAWICQECQRECVPIRAESRCMCGHRLKQHTQGQSAVFTVLIWPGRCSVPSCSCPKFSFIVAEGSWILRCRCKHKHTEHDPASHACSKAACSCSGFSSPWVCNCNHPWSQHQQVLVERQVCARVWDQPHVLAAGNMQAGHLVCAVAVCTAGAWCDLW
ncbi:hypothetical protein COO60DRAFT_1275316 [Scenedesmus sp. NREL 46B-D3]|nr:hypothetical protein COO60DRAFT_1275316 [Scenedesmus sp. NREL 46B-D3]